MPEKPLDQLGRRERQIMDVVLRRGRATAGEVHQDLPDAPSYSTIRAMLRYLEGKGYLRHVQEGARYVYMSTADKGALRSSAVSHLVKTFFDGSVSTAVAALLNSKGISKAEKARLEVLLAQHAKGGKGK